MPKTINLNEDEIRVLIIAIDHIEALSLNCYIFTDEDYPDEKEEETDLATLRGVYERVSKLIT